MSTTGLGDWSWLHFQICSEVTCHKEVAGGDRTEPRLADPRLACPTPASAVSSHACREPSTGLGPACPGRAEQSRAPAHVDQTGWLSGHILLLELRGDRPRVEGLEHRAGRGWLSGTRPHCGKQEQARTPQGGLPASIATHRRACRDLGPPPCLPLLQIVRRESGDGPGARPPIVNASSAPYSV